MYHPCTHKRRYLPKIAMDVAVTPFTQDYRLAVMKTDYYGELIVD
jgi:hypothetical protein